MNQNEMEKALRSVLVERSNHAPTGETLAEQIIATAGSPTVRTLRTHRRRTWTLPLLAAAAVAAVAAGTVTLITVNNSTSSGHPVAAPTNTVSHPPVSSTPPVSTVVFSGPDDLLTTADSSSTAIGLENFTALDLTFVGNHIWALGTATCLKSGLGLCTAFVHTSDGAHWTTIPSTPFNVPGDTNTNNCAVRCVSHMRFASEKIGYVYGPSALLMTLDGGKTWKPEAGGAVALETLSGNVIRVEEAPAGACPPGCTYTVQTAPIGSTHWTTVPVSIPPMNGVGAQLTRFGHAAYLLLTANPAGGAGSAKSELLSSSNDGASWTNRGEPCPQLPDLSSQSSEVDSTALAIGAGDGSVIVACEPRGDGSAHGFVAVSPAGAAHFATANAKAAPAGSSVVSAATAKDLCVGAPQLYCSHDGGASFASTKGAHGGPGEVSFIGFEGGTEGHALEITGSAANSAVSDLWTTSDGGQTWSVRSIAAS